MPIYDYRCELCGKVEEVITTNIHEKIEKYCSECNKEMKRVFANKLTFKLLGEGWAIDNYEYPYTKCKAGPEKVKSTVSQKTIDKKMKEFKRGRD